MEKFELLKAVIYQVICENKLVIDALERLNQEERLSNIDISYLKGSICISSTGTIKLSMPDIIGCYDLAINYELGSIEKFQFNPEYLKLGLCYQKSNGISINYASAEEEIVSEKLNNTDFLTKGKDVTIAKFETIAINAMAYMLYHEIGHIVYDGVMEDSCQIEKENKADEFAFEALKSMCNGNYEETNNVKLLGAFIGIAHILLIRTPQEEREDEEHPHSIERLYALLDYWGISDDSCYWELAYKVVGEWSAKNNLDMAWEKETSTSCKDKFMDAYTHFRKSPQ